MCILNLYDYCYEVEDIVVTTKKDHKSQVFGREVLECLICFKIHNIIHCIKKERFIKHKIYCECKKIVIRHKFFRFYVYKLNVFVLSHLVVVVLISNRFKSIVEGVVG